MRTIHHTNVTFPEDLASDSFDTSMFPLPQPMVLALLSEKLWLTTARNVRIVSVTQRAPPSS